MTKEELKIKSEVKRLAAKLKFQSVMFADEFEFSNREDLRYQLWMVELTKWLMDAYQDYIFTNQPHLRMINFVMAVDCPEYLSEKLCDVMTQIVEAEKQTQEK